MSKLSEECLMIYVSRGQQAVYDYIKQTHPEILWKRCDPCEDETPVDTDGRCLICDSGSNYSPMWEVIIGDFTAVVCAKHAGDIIKDLDPSADPALNYNNETLDIYINEDFYGQLTTNECWDCEKGH